jgi:hypothetical protein
MKPKSILLSLLLALSLPPWAAGAADPAPKDFQPRELPVRALMLCGMSPRALDDFLEFVAQDLPKEGVNTLVFQIDYSYQFKSHPEMIAEDAFSEAQIKALVRTCRAAGITLVPLLNCLGHQSWAETTGKLLTTYPGFDETPGLYPGNKGIYCRSYCPNHPGVHRVIFDLLGEIAAVFEADAVHVGMDEVWLIGEDGCPRCRGADKAGLFAQEVRTLHDFLATRGVRLWLWGDRLLDGRTTGLGEWEASMNKTHRAIDLVPKDVVICDWHYDAAVPTPEYFAMKGLDVVICSYNKSAVGVAEAGQMAQARLANRDNGIGPRLRGVMATNWDHSPEFAATYRAAKASGAQAASPSVENFIRVFECVRQLREPPKTEPLNLAPESPKPGK